MITTESASGPSSKRPNKSLRDAPAAAPRELLRPIPLLDILGEPARRKFLEELTEAHYGKGQYIFRQGEPADYFHIVTRGSVKCVKSSPEGRECTLKVLMPGDLFCCEAAVFDGSPHPGTAQPMGEVSVLRLSKTAENATDYSLNNTVRNMLWLPTTREMKYQAKQAVDTFFVRMGDVASTAVVAGAGVGLGLGDFDGKLRSGQLAFEVIR